MLKRFFKKGEAGSGGGESPPGDPNTETAQLAKLGGASSGGETLEEIRAQRDELSQLMAGISDAILALDLEESPLFFNSQFAVLVGQEMLNQGRHKLVEMFRDPDILNAFRVSLTEGKHYSLKAIPHHQGGKKKFFSLSVSALRKPDRSIYGAVGIFHDVTDLKLAEQMRIDFVANVSHEVRTPLTAVKGYTDTLMSDLQMGRPLEKSFLDVISRNVERLMAIIDDLLDLSGMDSGFDLLHKERVSTEELTARILQQMSGKLLEKGQRVESAFGASFVLADQKRIEQVLVNLLDNASKYTPRGGVLRVIWESEPTGDVQLRIEDNGPGIPYEHHDRLFERFYRVDKGRSRDTGGTGLGLAIVKNIMQRHGGAVWVQSEPGRGSRFTCQFPNEVLVRS